jgi:hypothetical protein
MKTGDVDFAFRSLLNLGLAKYSSGLPLSPIIADLETFARLAQQYPVETFQDLFKPFQEMLLCLVGRTEKPLVWATELPVNLCPDSSPNARQGLVWKYICRIQISFYLGDIDLAEKMRVELDKLAFVHTIHYFAVSGNLFFSGLLANAMYRKTRRGEYRKRAVKATEQMKKLTQKRGLNILHKFLLLEAELSGTLHASKVSLVKARFDRAIATATRAGILQDAALANELAGDFCLRVGDHFWARHYLTCAHSLYLSWEAEAKVQHLVKKHASFIQADESESQMFSSSSLTKSIARSAVTMHRRISFVNTSWSPENSSSDPVVTSEASTEEHSRFHMLTRTREQPEGC